VTGLGEREMRAADREGSGDQRQRERVDRFRHSDREETIGDTPYGYLV
jgi:hypothetical protein